MGISLYGVVGFVRGVNHGGGHFNLAIFCFVFCFCF